MKFKFSADANFIANDLNTAFLALADHFKDLADGKDSKLSIVGLLELKEDRVINTTKGLIEESLLIKKEGREENENEICEWVEYWDDKELVHRSVHLTLKTNVVADGIAEMIG